MTRFGAIVLTIVVALLMISCVVNSEAARTPPAITAVSPSSVAAGSADFTVAVSGSNFNTRSVVTVNGSPRATAYISQNQLAARILSGDVHQAGTIQLVITGLGTNSTSNAYAFSVTAPQALQVATSSLPRATVQVPYAASMAWSGGVAPYSWKLASGQLPPGVALDSSSGLLNGVPSQTGQYNFSAQVTDSSTTPQTASSSTLDLAVTVSTLVLSSATLPNGTVQVAYSASLSASGGTQPYTWSVISGALPPGISLSATTGALSGTPSQSGGFTFTVQLKDSSATPQTATNTFTITVAAPKLVISTTSLPNGTVAQAYSASLQATGGTPGYTWSITSGALPVGLSLASSGAISGTPSSAGSWTFTVQVKDSASAPQSATQSLTLSVSSAVAPLSINSFAPPGGITQSSYSSTISATGGVTPYTWSVSSGSLPPGVSLNASTGAITGTPTTTGTFNFSVQVKDSSPTPQSASTSASILIVAPLKITTTSLPALQLQTSYSVTLGVSGGMAPYVWSVASGSLPTGLSLNSSTGVISGTPTTAGTYSFTIRVDDPPSLPQSASQAFSASVPAASVSVSVSPAGASLQVGQPQQFTATVSNSTNIGVTWDVNGIPGGNTTVGTIVGGLYLAPAAVPSPSTVTVRATSQADPTKSASASVAISAPVSPLAIVTSSLPSGTVQTAYSATLSAMGGTAPYSWSVASGSLPQGLSLNGSTGAISGTPIASGTSSFTTRVSDSGGQSAQQPLSINVLSSGPLPLAITTNSLPPAQVSQAYSATLQATGGTPGYTWSITSGSLPAGLSLMAASGQISGTPSVAGQFSFTAQVSDSASLAQTASAAFTLTVSALPAEDQYGGLLAMPSPNGATGNWRMEKFGNRWMFVTPAGNAFWMMGVYVLDGSDAITDQGISYNQIRATKYPDTNTWANQMLKRINSWGFNTVGEYGNEHAWPFDRPTGALLLPLAFGIRPTFYGLTNAGSYAPGPFKGLEDCLNLTVYTGYVGGGPPDVYDPNFDAYVNGRLAATAADPHYSKLLTSPWVIGLSTDDTDDLYGFGPSLQVPGQNGVVAVHIGWLALAVSPTKTSSAKYGVTYADPTVYTKKALHDFLVAKYGTISALNAAWGSNYTTFDSAGGWGVGTGMMDEDGRHTAWLGDTDGTLRYASAGVVAGLDAFLYQYAAKYFSITAGRLRQYAPNHLVFGPSVLNGRGGLTRAPILQAAGQYLDVIHAGVSSQQVLDLTVQYAGDKPLVTWEGWVANPDSNLWRYPNPVNEGFSYPDQASRALNYTSRLNFLLTATTTLGTTKPIVGFKWWQWTDNWGEKLNWGLVSLRDNAYDSKEAVISAGTDPWGYLTGGEEKNYGDFISAVRIANQNVLKLLVP